MKAWFAELPSLGQVGLGLLLLVLLVGVLIFLFLRLRKYLEWQNVKTLEIEKRVGLKIEFIKTAAQILGGVFFLITIYVALANLAVSEEKYKTDLFVQAIKQLGDGKLEVRLGGIYALERIARDSEKDHGPIMEVLTAFVRLHAPWTPEKAAAAKEQQDKTKKPTPGEKKPETEVEEIKPPADIQAILTVLGRRARTYKKEGDQRLDLRRTDLRGADLYRAHLEGALLSGAQLEGAGLVKAHLEGADLNEAHLEDAVLNEAHLEDAWLEGTYLEGAKLALADLQGADLQKAHLERAYLEYAHLERAMLFEAHLEGAVLNEAHLEGAYLRGADLRRADLQKAHLEGAVLQGAHLEGVDLREAKGLTQEQIDSAIIDEKTELPNYLKKADPDKAKPQ